MADDRRLSFIIVPHGDLETRTYDISYRALKLLLGAAALLLVVFVVIASSWWFVATQAARVGGLEREVARLEEERAKVAELARNLEEAEQQYERVRQLLGVDGSGASTVVLPPLRNGDDPAASRPAEDTRPTAWPLTRAGFITQMREVTAGGEHPGIDIAVPSDTYIRAAGPGVVRDAGVDPVYGRFVLIDHGDGLESMYGHASRLFVESGDTVARSEVIGLSGSTGRSTAPHLHFEIRDGGQAVDPLAYVRQPS